MKTRHDGKGDSWALQHRHALGEGYSLIDVDAAKGVMTFSLASENRLWLELQEDHWATRYDPGRQIAMVALIDRKTSLAAARDPRNRYCYQIYGHMCRSLSARQPVEAAFLVVSGTTTAPWICIRVDPWSGREICLVTIGENSQTEWLKAWEKLGLIEIRKQLKSWLTKSYNEEVA